MIAWPETELPPPLRDDFSRGFVDNSLSKLNDVGPPGKRRRYSLVPKVMRMSLFVSVDQLALFDLFYQDDLKSGTLPFTMPDPVFDGQPILLEDGSPWLDEDDQPILQDVVRIYLFGKNAPQITPRGAIDYKVSFDVAELP